MPWGVRLALVGIWVEILPARLHSPENQLGKLMQIVFPDGKIVAARVRRIIEPEFRSGQPEVAATPSSLFFNRWSNRTTTDDEGVANIFLRRGVAATPASFGVRVEIFMDNWNWIGS
jgi:hypothetical protein